MMKNVRMLLALSLMVIAVGMLHGCREAPTMPDTNPLDPSLDNFGLTTPKNVSAVQEKLENTYITWEDSNENRANRYQIEVFALELSNNTLEKEKLIEINTTPISDSFSKSWRDPEMNALVKGYSVRALYVNKDDTVLSAWSDTATVNYFKFEEELKMLKRTVVLELDYQFPADVNFGYQMELITENGETLFDEKNLKSGEHSLVFNYSPRFRDINRFSFRTRLQINDVYRDWVYSDTLRADPDSIKAPDQISLSQPDGETLFVGNSLNYDRSYNNRLIIKDCHGNLLLDKESYYNHGFQVPREQGCYPYQVTISSSYRFFECESLRYQISQNVQSNSVQLSGTNYPYRDIELLDVRPLPNGNVLAGVGERRADGKYVVGYGVHHSVMRDQVVMDEDIAPVVGIHADDPNWFMVLTDDEIQYYRNINGLTNKRSHSFNVDVTNVDWFYGSLSSSFFAMAYEGEIRFYDSNTSQETEREPVQYDKVRYLWGEWILIQDGFETNVMNFMTGEIQHSWQSKTIEWYTGLDRAAILFANGNVVIFSPNDGSPAVLKLPGELNWYNIRGIFPVSTQNVVFSIVSFSNTYLYHYNAADQELVEIQSWQNDLTGFHGGWIFDETPFYAIDFMVTGFSVENEYGYELDEL